MQTVLYILNAEGLEIDQVLLPIHKWKNNFHVVEVPIGGGSMIAKVRMKQLMQVENFKHNSDLSDQEQSEADSLHMIQNTYRSTNYLDEHKDELQRVKKELQDKIYYSNKLKSDRNILMTKNLDLEGELSTLKRKIKEQWSQIEKNFKAKIEIRQHIYEE